MRYSNVLVNHVLAEYRSGRSASELADDHDLPSQTVQEWIDANPISALDVLRREFQRLLRAKARLENAPWLKRSSPRTRGQIASLHRFIIEHEENKSFTVLAMCRTLRVSRQAHYSWRRRDMEIGTVRRREENEIAQKMLALHAQSGGLYGLDRLTKILKLYYPRLGRRRVHRLMKEHGIKGSTRRPK